MSSFLLILDISTVAADHIPSHCARQSVDLGTSVGNGLALRKAIRGFTKGRKAKSFTFEASFNGWQPSTLQGGVYFFILQIIKLGLT